MTGTRPLVSILVPAFNEADIVPTHIRRVMEHLRSLEQDYRWELVVVDDGSTDGTADLLTTATAGVEGVRVLRHIVNLGLGQALRTGFRDCRGEYIVVLDLDLTYAPDHVGALLRRIRETGAMIVLASPYMSGGRTTSVPWLRRLLSRWGNRFLALTARGVNPGGNLATWTGMVRAYDARFIRSLHLKSTGMEINTEILYKGLLLNARIEEIPAHLDWSDRKPTLAPGASGKRIRRGIQLSVLAGFTIRPFAFFIIPASILGIVAIYMLTWIVIHVVHYYPLVQVTVDTFDDRFSAAVAQAFLQSPHAFIVAGITLVLSVQLLSLGVMALQAKHYFEELFHFGTRMLQQAQDLERAVADDPRDAPPAGRGARDPKDLAP